MKRLGFRSRLFLILALFAFVPAILLTAAWGGAIARLLPRMSGTAAWDSAAASGTRALEVARSSGRLSAAQAGVLADHERELATSLTQARRFEYLARQLVPAMLLIGVVALAVLTFLASRAAGHLSRQLSRPLDELVGWTGRIRDGKALPAQTESRGAPEFALLRDGMRQMAHDLDAGRRAALEAERLTAFRESARQMAHEIKNPLTPIRFAVDRLKRSVPPELSDTVEVLQVESARLEAMARSFAQFGRLPEGPLAEIDLGELVQTTARTTVPEQVWFQLQAEEPLPLLRGYYDALSRAVANVLLNAVEACQQGGAIDARVVRLGANELMLAVHDTGSGIPTNRVATIWEPYVTLKAAGTGLGLAIVKQTVEAHGGRVEAQSSPEAGTEIRLIFPVTPPVLGTSS